MKNNLTLILLFLLTFQYSHAQTTAMDFTMDDCEGNMHHLFSTLDSGNVVVMEFFMTCNMCVNAGNPLESLIDDLNAEFPDKIKWYQIAYTNSYSCATITNFITSNGFHSIPFDSGAVMVAYYGGFGMPTIAVVAGANHEVLFTDVGWSNNDTAIINDAVHDFFNATGVNALAPDVNSLNVFPNPASDVLSIQIDIQEGATLELQLLDIEGRLVLEIFNGQVVPGKKEYSFDVGKLSNGIYTVQAVVNEQSITRQVSITK